MVVLQFPTTSPLPDPVEEQDETCPALPEALKFPAGFSDRAWYTGAIYEEYSRLRSPEGYELYHEACFMALLSILSLRRISIPFTKKDYTPLMIILMGEPAMYKKTTTADVINKVLRSIGLEWIIQSGKFTPQKLVHDMAGTIPKDYSDLSEDAQARIRQRLAFAGQRGLVIGEFGQFVKSMMNDRGPMAEFQSLLLEMDDCRDIYDTGTISRGDETIKEPFLSLVGGMTPTNVRILAKADAELYGSGFWSRVAVVCPPADTSIDFAYDLGEVEVPETLKRALLSWHKRLGVPDVEVSPVYETNKKGDMVPVTGKYTMNDVELPEVTVSFGTAVYEAWKQYRSAIKAIATTELQYKDLRGNYDRLPVKAMRMAALLASLENSDRVELWHWAKAQEISERWRYSLHELYRQSNSPPMQPGQNLEDVLQDTLKQFQAEGKKPTVRDMQQRTRKLKRVQARKINEALKQLLKDGVVMINREGRTERYCLPIGEIEE